jgi:hypothetical protein
MEAVLEKILIDILIVVAQVGLVRLFTWWRARSAEASSVAAFP